MLGIGPESKKKTRLTGTAAAQAGVGASTETAPQPEKPQPTKKGKRVVPDSWCDYVVVSDSWDGLAPAALRKPKKEKVEVEAPPSKPDEPLDIPSSPEVGLITRESKRKETSPAAAPTPPPSKKQATSRIGKRGNLDKVAGQFSAGNQLLHMLI